MKRVLLGVVAATSIGAVACGSKQEGQARAAPAVAVPAASAAAVPSRAATPVAVEPQPLRLGEPMLAAPGVELSRVLAEPKSYADQRITVEGVVREVCRARGCWLELATATDPSAQGCRVVMKDHAFFVPTDSVGRRVRVQGAADVQSVPAAQVTHMEHEGGRFNHKQPDGSAQELRIIASGVELLPAPSSAPL